MGKRTITHVDEEGRVCTRCLKYKIWDLFPYRGGTGPNNRNSMCKACCSLRAKACEGDIVDYENGNIIRARPKIKKTFISGGENFGVKYPAPNIDEIIGFVIESVEE